MKREVKSYGARIEWLKEEGGVDRRSGIMLSLLNTMASILKEVCDWFDR